MNSNERRNYYFRNFVSKKKCGKFGLSVLLQPPPTPHQNALCKISVRLTFYHNLTILPCQPLKCPAQTARIKILYIYMYSSRIHGRPSHDQGVTTTYTITARYMYLNIHYTYTARYVWLITRVVKYRT